MSQDWSGNHQPAPGCEQAVAALRRRETYPEAPSRVEVIETHLSWVFLTDRHAFKLKKPMRYNSADFRTLSARLTDCREEVQLNQRLAEGVYLGVVPLACTRDGRLLVGGEGTVVEWLVKMRRLPAERMLDTCLRRGAVTPDELRAVARKLARLYLASTTRELSGAEYRLRLRRELEGDQVVLSLPEFQLPLESVGRVCRAQAGFITDSYGLLAGRVAAGRLVEGHGDLRPAHVCLISPPVIFDCLEFDRRLRLVDAADELAFLALECERIGAPQVGPLLFEEYTTATGDRPSARLLDFYKSWRALTWARLAVLRSRETGADRAKWLRRAQEYLSLADRYAERLAAADEPVSPAQPARSSTSEPVP